MNSTSNPPNRRSLHFNTIDDAIAEATRLAAADRAGKLKQLGNWSLGQALAHCAAWSDFAFIGYPHQVAHPPLPVRLIARLLRNRILTKAMMPGMKIGRVPNGTLALDILPTDEALPKFVNAFTRLRDECPKNDNPVFGPLTHAQWIQLNLRHTELHLSFHLPAD
jgi:hypothetical protein